MIKYPRARMSQNTMRACLFYFSNKLLYIGSTQKNGLRYLWYQHKYNIKYICIKKYLHSTCKQVRMIKKALFELFEHVYCMVWYIVKKKIIKYCNHFIFFINGQPCYFLAVYAYILNAIKNCLVISAINT